MIQKTSLTFLRILSLNFALFIGQGFATLNAVTDLEIITETEDTASIKRCMKWPDEVYGKTFHIIEQHRSLVSSEEEAYKTFPARLNETPGYVWIPEEELPILQASVKNDEYKLERAYSSGTGPFSFSFVIYTTPLREVSVTNPKINIIWEVKEN